MVTTRTVYISKAAAAANTDPAFTDATATRSVAENTAADRDIGAPVEATDADGDTLTYSLSGTDASSFRIDASSGQLKTRAALDFETKPSYAVTVGVSDSKDASGTADTVVDDTIEVTITVTDEDESVCNAPNLAGRRQIWRAVVTVGEVIHGGNVIRHGATETVGGLSEHDFSIGSNNYNVRKITQWVLGIKALEFELDSAN